MANSITDEFSAYHQFVAERVYFHFCEQVSEIDLGALRPAIQVDAVANQMARGFIVTLKGWMMGRKIPTSKETRYHEYPDGAWQMFKRAHAPKWFLAHFPVRLKRFEYVHTTNEYSLCPHIQTESRDQHLYFMMRQP